MEIKNITVICFSPTGATKKAALQLFESLDQPSSFVDLSVPGADYSAYSFGPQDLCVIAVPSFGGRVPAVAADRIQQMTGGGAQTVILAAYGNRDYDDTLMELLDVADAAGFHCIAAVAASTEHSIFRQYGAGRPDDFDVMELSSFGRQIYKALSQCVSVETVEVPGKRPYQEYNGVPMKPQAGKKCTGCQACAKVCPVGAIPLEHPQETDEALCISCMRCVEICPEQARKCSPLLLLAGSQKLKKACSGRKKNVLFLGKGVK